MAQTMQRSEKSAAPFALQQGANWLAGARVDLLHEVLESLPQGVIMFTSDGRVEFTNRRYVEMYGLAPDCVQPGVTLYELFAMRMDPGTAKRASDRAFAAVRRGEVTSKSFTTPGGQAFHYIITPLPSGAWIVTHEDVTQQRLAEAQIEHMAHHDALTDLPNRSALRTHLEQALRYSPRGKLLSVMFLDLDNFKGINDTLGHQVGDELLQTVALRLQACMRSSDLVARLGGDEFVIVSTALDKPSEAAVLATRIREELLKPFDLQDNQVAVDTSIGISIFPNDGSDADQLLKSADLALYSAKGSGRGTYRFFENEMDARMTERRNLELDLRAGFVNGEFEIHYQPLVNLETGDVTSCEALLRWNSPKRGCVPPQTFIPVAEEIGLMPRIGEWVIRTACAEAVKWPQQVTVAVNVSPVQFRSQNLVQIIVHALATTRLAPNRLEIEITEALLLEHTEDTLRILNQLHTLGVKIAMDDFGTGYSSLSYLQKFPFDKIKIDQTFIKELSNGSDSTAIVRAVTGLAVSLHMITTAEGVETEDQRAIVTELGCTEMQGYLFSAARPADEILNLLLSSQSEQQRRLTAWLKDSTNISRPPDHNGCAVLVWQVEVQAAVARLAGHRAAVQLDRTPFWKVVDSERNPLPPWRVIPFAP